MAHVSYLSLTGEKQGLISSGCNTKDSMGNRYQETHTNEITVLECQYSMSKLPSQPGIKHGGIQITKPKDKASPLLATAFAKQEHLEGTIVFYRTNEKGHYEKHYAIEFQKAVITGISISLPHTVHNNSEEMHEVITLNYKGIQIIHFPCGTMASDGWEIANYLGANTPIASPLQQTKSLRQLAKENSEQIKKQVMNSVLKECDIVRRSEWNAKPSKNQLADDWDYNAIALHHAGNSFSSESTVSEIQTEHLKKYDDIGYHYAVNYEGKIFEGRPLIYKGSHIYKANSHKIGIVMIGDFSSRGEAEVKLNDMSSWADHFDFSDDGQVPEKMHNALTSLIKTLCKKFPKIKTLGGHREFAVILGQTRTCPGDYGIEETKLLRKDLKLQEPK
ncbi:type VI secretion system tube protein TssD [Vibrio quintilis]|uniref:Major exported protein n=1 Tax=Vibrio quintilis TaxID=1117707 RepID=A0A1M7YP82_9VIBR|nr:type VI secretion system tube protein TssD [Vibrio quintilis]SHO54422.1 Major exported protein [Vibrio quintilis]